MADEKLIIDVVARDGISPVLDKAGQNVSGFTKEAEANFKRMDAAVGSVTTGMQRAGTNIDATKKKAIDFANEAQRKFEALGKAAIGIFAADVAARVLGFTSAMDALNKAAEAAAQSIQKALGLESRLAQIEAERLELQANAEAWRALAKAREEYLKPSGLQIPAVSGSFEGRRKFSPQSFAAGEFGSIQFGFQGTTIPTQGLSDQQIAQVIQRAEAIRSQIPGLEAEAARRFSAQSNGAFAETAQAIQQDLQAKIESAAREVEIFAENLRFSNYLAEREAEIERAFQQDRLQRQRSAVPFGPEAPEVFNVPPGFEFIPTPSGSRRSSGAGSSFSPAFDAANARRRAVAERAAANRARNQVQPLIPDLSTDLLGEQTRQLASFADQAAESFNRLGDSVRNSIGDQVVLGSFNALTNFFAAAVQGQATLRDLGRSFVQLGAQILAQQAALRVLGFFGFGGAVASSAGGVGGAGAAAGGATAGIQGGGGFNLGGGGIPIGVQGGGGGVSASINLSVTSLDPRGAADVVLSQMPAIQRALAQSITSGASRSLRVAVGSV